MRTRLGPRRLVAIPALLVSATLAAGCAAPAADDGGAAGERQEETMPDEERLEPDDGGLAQQDERYVDRLVRAAKATGRYSGSVLRQPQRRLVVYAVGVPSDDVRSLIERAPRGLEVEWREAPYTEQELVAESQRIMQEFPALHTGSPRPDGSGLHFTTSDRRLLQHPEPARALGTDYPVTVTEGPRPSPVAEPATTG